MEFQSSFPRQKWLQRRTANKKHLNTWWANLEFDIVWWGSQIRQTSWRKIANAFVLIWPGQAPFRSCRHQAQKKEPESSSVFVVTFVTHHAESAVLVLHLRKIIPSSGSLKFHPDSHVDSIIWKEVPMNYGSKFPSAFSQILVFIVHIHTAQFIKSISIQSLQLFWSSSHIASRAPWCQSLSRP